MFKKHPDHLKIKELKEEIRKSRCNHKFRTIGPVIKEQIFNGRYWDDNFFIPQVCSKECGETRRLNI